MDNGTHGKEKEILMAEDKGIDVDSQWFTLLQNNSPAHSVHADAERDKESLTLFENGLRKSVMDAVFPLFDQSIAFIQQISDSVPVFIA